MITHPASDRRYISVMRPALIGLLCLQLVACGFQLLTRAELPAEMAKTQLVIEDPGSTLARRVTVLLRQSGVELVAGSQATAVLEIPRSEVLTEVLTIGDNARVREYRVTHTVQFRLLDANGSELVPLQTMRQSREVSFDEQQILACSREQDYVREDLANTLSRLLVARLEVVGSQAP